jgi:hypothetical protein
MTVDKNTENYITALSSEGNQSCLQARERPPSGAGRHNRASKLCLDAREPVKCCAFGRYTSALQPGEPHQVGAQTEAGALACSQPNGRGQQVQQSECHGGDDGHRQDLLHIQLLLGDDEGRQRHGQTLQEILDRASHKLSHSETVHPYTEGNENLPQPLPPCGHSPFKESPLTVG